MAEFYGPFNTGTGSSLDETKWRELFGAAITTGVLKGAKVNGAAGGDLAVTAPGSGMQVNMATGEALVYGFFYQNDASKALTITAADPSLPRIDRVIVKLDLTARTIASSVKAGTPAASPSAPTLTQTATTWEMSLAQIAVAAGASVISSGNVTDERTYATATNTVAKAGDTMTGPLTIAKAMGGSNFNAFVMTATDGKSYGFIIAPGTNTLTLWNFTDGVALAVWTPAGGLSGALGTYWASGNDGSGSGLDADKLDGLEAAALAQIGAHNGVTFKLSAGAGAPASLNANEIYFQLS